MSSNVRWRDAREASRYQGIMIQRVLGRVNDATNLVFRGLGVEHGEEHVAVAIAF